LKTLLAVVLPVVLAACGSSYDPSYTIPADSKMQSFQPREQEEILDEAGLIDEEEEDDGADEDGAEDSTPTSTEDPTDSEAGAEGAGAE